MSSCTKEKNLVTFLIDVSCFITWINVAITINILEKFNLFTLPSVYVFNI